MVDDRVRHRLVVSGVVQGVGFRPVVYALASKFGLSGSVGNDSMGVTIEIEGSAAAVAEFRDRLPIDARPWRGSTRSLLRGSQPTAAPASRSHNPEPVGA
jgi:acylphosphatase